MRSVETSHATFNYDSNKNLLVCRVKQNQMLDVKEVTEMIDATEQLVGYQHHYALLDFGSFLETSVEARKYYAEAKYVHAFREADAFLVKSLALRIIGHFFINVIKPRVRTRLFTDEAKALKWLHSIQKKNAIAA